MDETTEVRLIGELRELARAVAAGAVIVLRRQRPNMPRPYRVPVVWVIVEIALAIDVQLNVRVRTASKCIDQRVEPLLRIKATDCAKDPHRTSR